MRPIHLTELAALAAILTLSVGSILQAAADANVQPPSGHPPHAVAPFTICKLPGCSSSCDSHECTCTCADCANDRCTCF